MRTGKTIPIGIYLIFTVFSYSVVAFAVPSDQVSAAIRSKMETLRLSGKLSIAGSAILSRTYLLNFYEKRQYQRAWAKHENIAQLLGAIKDIYADGLAPRDYHYTELNVYQQQLKSHPNQDPHAMAEFDILLTDSIMLLFYSLFFGRVDPETINPYMNLVRTIDDRDPLELIQEAIDSDSLNKVIDNYKPNHTFYRVLKNALTEYRAIKDFGGWPKIPEGERLMKGMRDSRIPLIRQRLQLTSDLRNNELSSTLFDEELERALIRFQIRHYIEPDGILDRNTLQVLNEPVQARIDQIRANLERIRWVHHGVPRNFVIVDIAGYFVHYGRNRRFIWSTRAQVGKPFRQTPVFKSEIRTIVLNPTWTVPPGVFRINILPEVKKDPTYLEKLSLKIYSAKNDIIDADKIDWSKYPRHKFPYTIRQGPGPTNPLGEIKFVIPNPFYIYLHDTPEQDEFESPWRALSAGCIRIENPLKLAELVLDDRKHWSIERLQEYISSGRTIRIHLPDPQTILLLYLTVWIDAQKEAVFFREDVYRRDAKILEELNGVFKIRKRPLVLNPIL